MTEGFPAPGHRPRTHKNRANLHSVFLIKCLCEILCEMTHLWLPAGTIQASAALSLGDSAAAMGESGL